MTGSLAAAMAASAPRAVFATKPRYTRYNIYNVIGRCSLNPILTGYDTAVSAMLALSQANPNDARGWLYQANMHGTYATPALGQDWNQCQHASYSFLSWHRMFLYWFERIVRSKSGVSNFALPYWNYTNGLTAGNTENVLPPPFSDPASVLFTTNRNPGINSGSGLPASAIAIAASMNDSDFSAGGIGLDGFGGAPIAAPDQHSEYGGDLENQPHNPVHDAIGGLMGDPFTAAQDPIFWLHHANVDRLWARWTALGGGRHDPTDSVWLTTPFTFYDENAKPRVMTGAQIISTVHLNYAYNESEPPALKCSPPPAARLVGPRLDAVLAREPTRQMTMDAVPVGGVMLRAAFVTLDVGLVLKPQTLDALATRNVTNSRILLRLEGIAFDRSPGYYYELYLNLPAGVRPDYRDEYYVGNLSFFGSTVHVNGRMVQRPETFNITPLVQRQLDTGRWNSTSAKLTLVMQGAADATRLRGAASANTRINNAVITDER